MASRKLVNNFFAIWLKMEKQLLPCAELHRIRIGRGFLRVHAVSTNTLHVMRSNAPRHGGSDEFRLPTQPKLRFAALNPGSLRCEETPRCKGFANLDYA